MTLARGWLLLALLASDLPAKAAGDETAAVEPAAETPLPPPDPTEQLYRDLIARHTGSVATVSFVLTAEYAGTPNRMQGEVEGVVVRADGLVLLPGNAIDPARQYETVYRDMGQEGNLPRVTSSAFQVRLPGRTEPFDATLAGRDADLGLAWLRLRKPPADLPYVDLARGGAPRVGQRALVLSLATESFAFAPYVTEVRVQGEIETPYPAHIVTWPNKLVFDTDLNPLGFGVLVMAGQPGMMAMGLKTFTVMIPRATLLELTERVAGNGG